MTDAVAEHTPIQQSDLAYFLEAIRQPTFGFRPSDLVSARPWVTYQEVHELLVRAAGAGLVHVDDRGLCMMTDAGISLHEKGLPKRLTPPAAQDVLEAAIAAARKWNSAADHAAIVTSIRLMGSMLEQRADYGDVNLHVVFKRRSLPASVVAALIEHVPDRIRLYSAPDATPGDVIALHHRNLATRRIERAAAGISLFPYYEVEPSGLPWREVFRANPDGTEASPDPTTHPFDEKTHEEFVYRNMQLPRAVGRPLRLEVPELMFPSTPGPEPLLLREPISSYDIASHADQFWWGKPTRKGSRKAVELGYADRYTASLMQALDRVRARPVQAATSGVRLQSILKDAHRRGILSGGAASLLFSDVHAELRIPAAGLQPGEVLSIRALQQGRQKVLELTPRVLGQGMETTVCSSASGHVSLARTTASALFDLQSSLKIPGGAKPLLAVQIAQGAVFEPPSLGPICSRITKAAKELVLTQEEVAEITRLLHDPDTLRYHTNIQQFVAVRLFGPDAAETRRNSEGEDGYSEIEHLRGGIGFQARVVTSLRSPLGGSISLGGGPDKSSLAAVVAAALPSLKTLGRDWSLEVSRPVTFKIERDNTTPGELRRALLAAKVKLPDH